MSYNLTIKGYEDPRIVSLMKRARLACSNEVLNRFVGQTVRDGARVNGVDLKGIRQHILDEAPNHHETAKRLGAEPTNFYAKAASGIELIATGAEAQVIIINGAPIFSRVYSDVVITPRDGKQWLTIPAKASVYGKRAGEYPSKLQFINLTKAGGEPLGALVPATHFSPTTHYVNAARPARAATATKAASPAHWTGKQVRDAITQELNRKDLDIIYWCKKKVVLKQDPRLLPSREQLTALAGGGMYRAMQLALHDFNASLS